MGVRRPLFRLEPGSRRRFPYVFSGRGVVPRLGSRPVVVQEREEWRSAGVRHAVEGRDTPSEGKRRGGLPRPDTHDWGRDETTITTPFPCLVSRKIKYPTQTERPLPRHEVSRVLCPGMTDTNSSSDFIERPSVCQATLSLTVTIGSGKGVEGGRW